MRLKMRQAMLLSLESALCYSFGLASFPPCQLLESHDRKSAPGNRLKDEDRSLAQLA